MTLADSIYHAQALTDRLQEALASGQMEACVSLLADRAQAMADLKTCHEHADSPERTLCRPGLVALGEADRALQTSAASARDTAGQALRGQMGASPRFGGSYDTPPEQACLDRKA